MRNPLSKLSSRNQFSTARRRWLKSAVAGAITVAGTSLYAYEGEPEHLEIVHRTIRLPGWPSGLAGLRIGQLSDFHCQDDRSVARTGRAVKLLLSQRPDIVFMTGDFISGWAPYIEDCASEFIPLQTVPRGVFAILGNHDWGRGLSFERAAYVAGELKRVGITVLRNQSVPLPGSADVHIVGLDCCCKSQQDVVLALQGIPDKAIKLLLVHEPDYADNAPPGFALQLSGHSHAGQIRLPGLPPLHCPVLGRQYPEGLQQAVNHPVYTTRGIGMIGPQMRLFCPPEVTVLTLVPT